MTDEPTLRELCRAAAVPLRAADIAAIVARECGFDAAEIVGPRRQQALARARMTALALVRDLRGDMSYPQIGRVFDRDHSTVMHAVERSAELCATDPAFAATYARCRAAVLRAARGEMDPRQFALMLEAAE